MSCQNLTIKLDEDEDVILEGSELFQALMNLGFTNFDSIPRVKRNASFKMEPLYYQVYQYVYSTLKPKIHVLQNFFYQEDKFIIKQMKTILKADILLDDHSSFINELIYKKKSSCSFFYEWFPLFGTITTSTLYFFSAGKYSITFITFSFLLGLISYRKFQQWLSIKNLRNLVMLQSELLKLCKNSLKILRQIWSNKPLTIDIGGKNKLIGYKKWNIINDLSLVLMELFVDHSEIYYKLASKILSSTQDSILINCFLTEIKKKKHFINEYDHLHNFYYMYILVQSEMIYILASAYYIEEDYFLFSKLEWFDAFINLKNSLSFYCFKLSKLLKEYKLSDTKPVRHIFRYTNRCV